MPDFLVIGAPKAGTTALHSALARHPGLFMSPSALFPAGTMEHGCGSFGVRLWIKRAPSRYVPGYSRT